VNAPSIMSRKARAHLLMGVLTLATACVSPLPSGDPNLRPTATSPAAPSRFPTLMATRLPTGTTAPVPSPTLTASASPSPTATAPGATASAQSVATPKPAPSPTLASQAYADLLATAASQGHVLVIVQLRLPTGPFVPEGELSAAKLLEQRVAIAATRKALVESLAGSDAVVYAAWDSVPSAGIKVDETALRRIIASPFVLSIQKDSLSSTQ
jgi:hypothetical protein